MNEKLVFKKSFFIFLSLIILLNIVKLAIYAIGFLIAIFIPKWFNLMGVLFGYMVIKITIYIVSYQMKGVKG